MRRPTLRRAPQLLLLGALALLSACTSTRLSHSYRPSPADLPAVGEAGVAAARVLVSVVAVERFGRSKHEPWGVTLRVRIENGGERPLRVVPEDLQLLDAALNTFGPPSPAELPAIPARGAGTGELWFPLPAGAELRDVDLEGLNLRLTLDDGQARRSLAAGFQRYRRPTVTTTGWGYAPGWYGPGWYGPGWYGPGWRAGVGTVVVW